MDGGFFFLPVIPRALAAALTLALWSLTGLLFFPQLGRLVGEWRGTHGDDTRVRHVTMSLAAGTASLTFYSFAGAPPCSSAALSPLVRPSCAISDHMC